MAVTIRWILLLAIWITGSFSQAFAVTHTMAQDAVDEVFFEKEMESRLTRDIQAYLGHNRFIIGVDFQVNGPSGPGGEDNVIVREITTPLPGLPRASETFVRELTTEELTNLNESLQLDEQVGSRVGLLDNVATNPFTGSGTSVYLVFDATVTSIQENFIRDLIARKLALDVAGGDGIQVVRSDFSTGVQSLAPAVDATQQPQTAQQAPQSFLPQYPQTVFQPLPLQQQPGQLQQNADSLSNNQASGDFQPPASFETEEEREERIANAIREAANQAAQAVNQANAQAAQLQEEERSLLEQYWWVLVLMAFFLMFILIVAFLSTRRVSVPQQLSYAPPQPQSPQPVAASGGSAADLAPASGDSSNSQSRFGEVRRELAVVGLSAPQVVRSEMDSLMAQNRVDLIAPTYRVLGHTLFEALFGELPIEKQASFNEYISERDMSNMQIEAQARDLYTRLLRSANNDDDGSRSQAFRFLENLHVSQVISLIKGEKVRVKALVISQLQSKKASNVLQALDNKDRSEVVHELSQFETFPIEAFRDVATALAQKVQSIPAVENIATDGVTILINMLDNMSTVEESKILDELENKNPDLFLRLKKQYFTYNDLGRAPQKVMGEALLDLDKEVIARALLGASETITKRVMGSLPKRLADSVKEDINLQKGKVNSEQIQADRKAVLQVMRALVREGKIDLEKL